MCDGLSTETEARLYAIGATFLTVFISLVTLHDLYFDPLLSKNAPARLKVSHAAFLFHFVAATSLTILSLICYYLCHTTNPGDAEDWALERPDLILVNQYHELELKKDEEEGANLPFCKICNKPKPPRTSHCSRCRACRVRMDHHCDLIGNCVAYKNHKYFVLYLLYTTIGCLYSVGLQIRFLVHCQQFPRRLKGYPLIFAGVFTPFALVLALGVGIGVGVLLGWTLYLMLKNQTQVEYVKSEPKGPRNDPTETRSYSKGVLPNVMHVMGTNPLLWLIPYRESRQNRRKLSARKLVRCSWRA